LRTNDEPQDSLSHEIVMSLLDPEKRVNSPSRSVDAHAREYSRLCQAQPIELATFLAERGELAPAELAAVIRVDLRECWRSGKRVDAQTYLDRFPTVAADTDLAIDVIYAEYLVREQLGENPTLAEFVRRFPEFADVLDVQISFHDAIADPTPEDVCAAELAGTAKLHSQPQSPQNFAAEYEVLEALGRGGMAVVYKARQPALNRLVALKMVRRADLGNDELLARFRTEAEVVASLHHPQIVQVYDYGEHEGVPYLALELILGGTLGERLDGAPWNPRRAAALIEQVSRAVHYAHERGVVHRDLKPNNLLVCGDAEPLEVKIADFGLAKVFRDDCHGDTQTGALLGTPNYMAPEQAYGQASAVGPATDVYALGAILYELLSGQPPYRGGTAIEALQQLLLADPVSLHRLAPQVPRDLATICSRCLERAPERRYRSALELADDLRRYLGDRPIHARPSGYWERGWRWCRRNPALAASLGSVAALLVTVSAVLAWYSGRLSQQLTITRRAELAERHAHNESQLRLWDAYLSEISARNSSRRLGQRFEALDTIRRAKELLGTIGTSEDRLLKLRGALITSLSLPDFRRAAKICDHPGVYTAAVALDKDRIAFNVSDRELVVRRLSDGAVLAKTNIDLPAANIFLSADGKYVGISDERSTKVWKITPTGLVPAWQNSAMGTIRITPDGAHAIVCHANRELQLIQMADGALVRTLGQAAALYDCAFHATSRCAAICSPQEVRIVNWDTGELVAAWPGKDVVRIAWHPSGKQLATWNVSEIKILEIGTGKSIVEMPHGGYPQQMRFSADGSKLISCSLWDSRLLLWDVGTGQRELEIFGFANLTADIAPDGQLTLLRIDGSSIERWELADGSECRTFPRAWFPAIGGWGALSISPDSRLLVLSGDKGIELWDLQERRRVAVREDSLCAAMFDQRGNLVLARESGVYHWPRRDRLRTQAGKPPVSVVSFGPAQHIGNVDIPTSLATSHPKNIVVYGGADGWHSTPLSNPASGIVFIPEGDPRKSAMSDDERLAAVAGWESGNATVWDAATGELLADLPTGRHGVLEFSPDGRWLASTPAGVRIWRTADWTLAHELHAQGTTPTGLGLGFSADSRILAVGQPNGELSLFDPQQGVCLARFTHPTPNPSAQIAFTPDNRTLVTLPLTEQTPGRIWDFAKIRRVLRDFDLDWPADVLQASPAPDRVPPLEVTWTDGGWTLFQNAVRALQGDAAAAKPE
jgi:serine/threonine-protein kinase